MPNIHVIYKITNPKGNVYIGQTNNPIIRQRHYRLLHCKKQVKIYRSILKYGWESHKFEVLEMCEKHLANDLEVYYIKKYGSFDTPHGLNLTSGGAFGKLSSGSLSKISDSMKGKIIPCDVRKKISDSLRGRKQDPVVSAKIKEKITGLKRSPETIKNISKSKKGVNFSEKHIQSLRDAKRPPISIEQKEKMRSIGKERFALGLNKNLTGRAKKVFNPDTNELYPSLIVACEKLNLSYSAIKCQMNGRTKVKKTILQWYTS